MQQVLDTSKRVFSAAIAAATIAFSMGAGALVSPLTAQAASAGDLIKGTSLTTVYYQGYDGLRYAFPNEKTYFTWYTDFSDVVTISDTALAAITLGGNVVVRPGTNFVKVTSDAKTYAVGRNGVLHWIETEAVANDLAGSDWASNIIDVPDVFFDDYTVGTSLMAAEAFEGALFEMGGVTYLSWGGEMREVTASGMTANRFQDKYVLDGANIDDSALTMGDDITGELLSVVDVAQTEDDDAAVAGDLEISESSSMPAGASITGGANAVEAFSFDVAAGAEDATLDSVVLTMIGAGSTSNITGVYLYEGDTRLTESRSVNASTRQVTFSNVGLDVDAGDERTITVRVTTSTSQTAADTFGFEITAATDVTASGDVDGSFPVSGNIFTFTGSDSGTLTITKTGTIADPTIGEDDAEIGMFKATASGSEGAEIETITLNIDDAADHSDFKLWDGDDLIASGVDQGGDLVLFDLSDAPFAVEEGGNNIFTVTADIGGQDADAIKVFIENAVDLVAIGTDFGFGLTVDIDDASGYDGSSCTSSSGKCSYSTIVGGEVTIAFNGPVAGDIQVDSQDQTLFSFSMTAAQEVTVKDLDIIVRGDDDTDGDAFDADDDSGDDADGLINTGAEGNLKDIKIVNADTGAVLLSPLELDCVTLVCGADGTNDDAQTIDFTDDFVIAAGETLNLEVRADIDNGATNGAAYGATLDVSGLSIEDANGDALASTDIVPGSDLTGYSQVARSSTLTFSASAIPGDITVIDGTDNVTVMAFNAVVNNASDVTVTDFTLTVYGVEDTDDDGYVAETFVIGGSTNSDVNDYIESCSLYDGATLLDGPESPAANGQTIRFADISWTIDAGDTGLLSVVCNFANESTSGNALFSFDINDEDTDVVAEDADGDTLAASQVLGDDPNGATAPTHNINLKDNGSLSVSAGSATPQADLLIAGSTGNHVATYRFLASDESFSVSTLVFAEEQAEDDSNAVTTGTETTDDDAYIDSISSVSIEYTKADGTRATASSTISDANQAKFSNLDMYVDYLGLPNDVEVMVDLAYPTLGGGSADAGDKIRMALYTDSGEDTNFKATGVSSGATLDDDNQGSIGDDLFSTDGIHTFVVRNTVPTITLSSVSPSGAAVVGRNEVLRVNIAATATLDLVINKMMFKMSSTDANGETADAGDGTDTGDWNECDTNDGGDTTEADFDIYNLNESSSTTLDTADANWTLYNTSGVVCGTSDADIGFVRVSFPTAEVIPAGETYTYALYFDATGASASSDDSVRFDIPTDPIVSTWIDVGVITATAEGGFVSGEPNMALTMSDDVSSDIAAGDLVCFTTDTDCTDADDEVVYVSAVSTTDLTVHRGYLGDDITHLTTSHNVYRLPSSLQFRDDLSAAGTGNYFWGSYLVNDLTVTGNTITF